MVDREGDVDDNRHLRTYARRTDSRSATAVSDLFLRRGDCDYLRDARPLRVSPNGLENDKGSDSVVDRARDEPTIGKLHRTRIDDSGVTDRDELLSFFLRLRAEIDPEIDELSGLLALLGLDEVDRLFADDAEDVALPADEAESLPDENLRIPAPDRLNVAVSLIIDVADDDSDFIDVSGEHDGRRTAAIHFRETVARDITAYFRELLCLIAPHFCGRRLETGWARGIEQLLQETEGFGGDHLAGVCSGELYVGAYRVTRG